MHFKLLESKLSLGVVTPVLETILTAPFVGAVIPSFCSKPKCQGVCDKNKHMGARGAISGVHSKHSN